MKPISRRTGSFLLGSLLAVAILLETASVYPEEGVEGCRPASEVVIRQEIGAPRSYRLVEGVLITSGSGAIRAMEARTGKTLWEFSAEDLGKCFIFYRPGMLLLGRAGKVSRVDPLNGKSLWETALGDQDSIFNPVVGFDERVIFCMAGKCTADVDIPGALYLISPEDGHKMGELEIPNRHIGRVCITRDAIYLSHSGDPWEDVKIAKYSRADLSEVWSAEVPGVKPIRGRPSAVVFRMQAGGDYLILSRGNNALTFNGADWGTLLPGKCADFQIICVAGKRVVATRCREWEPGALRQIISFNADGKGEQILCEGCGGSIICVGGSIVTQVSDSLRVISFDSEGNVVNRTLQLADRLPEAIYLTIRQGIISGDILNCLDWMSQSKEFLIVSQVPGKPEVIYIALE